MEAQTGKIVELLKLKVPKLTEETWALLDPAEVKALAKEMMHGLIDGDYDYQKTRVLETMVYDAAAGVIQEALTGAPMALSFTSNPKAPLEATASFFEDDRATVTVDLSDVFDSLIECGFWGSEKNVRRQKAYRQSLAKALRDYADQLEQP